MSKKQDKSANAPVAWKNRLYRGDCKHAMQEMHEEGILADLIYLDPPFNSNQVYNLVFRAGGKDAQTTAFTDMWGTPHAEQLRLAFTDMLDGMAGISEALKDMVSLWVNVLLRGNNDDRRLLNYLVYITERLILMQKVLAPGGSIYLHCDPTASHYLKVMMDAVFGRENFRNEVVWHYATGGASKRHYAKKHDTLLFYTKDDKYYFDADSIRVPRTPEVLRRIRSGTPNATRATDETKLPVDVFTDINALNAMDKERLGYTTQKPLALLERIVKASCPDGGLVFDPFCGCGTTVEAAHKNKRNWIGVDISSSAIGEIQTRAQTRMHLREKRDFKLIECDPQTILEYNRLSPYEKQRFLVEQVGGVCGQRGADGGVDGEIVIHVGDNKDGTPRWGKMLISVKTGAQAKPAHIDELIGAMARNQAAMGGFITDKPPTKEMLSRAKSAKHLDYKTGNYRHQYSRLQIITADDVIEGMRFDLPMTLVQKKQDHDRGKQMPI